MSRLAGRDSPLGTVAQSLGQWPLLLRSMTPTWTLESVARIDPPFVDDHGITAFIWDIDGTLTAYHRTELLPEAAACLEALRQRPHLRHVILSNAPEWRFTELGALFPDMPVMRGYQVGPRVLMRRIAGGVDSWTAEDLAARLAEGAVVLRKPNADLVRLAVAELGGSPAGVVMVGDQHLTDVAGANLAGIRSIKLPNPARSTFPLSIRFTQRLEAMLYRLVPRRPSRSATHQER
ncbi:MAG: HAD hydrolase-like protein [Gemmatimonadota bacterium]|nr:HAD hydrolase-like protein [Gemmatimonadota bacterium]